MKKTQQEIMYFIAEYAYYMANGESIKDVPSIVYEQVDRDFNKFLDGEDVIKRIVDKRKSS